MVRIGITGQTSITPATATMLRAELVRLLSTCGGDLVGVSCLTGGADTAFAHSVLELGGRLEVVLPAWNHRQDREAEALVERAASVRIMDFDHADRAARAAANDAMLTACERLVAVWGGPEGERSDTGSLVEAARTRGVAVTVVWPVGAARE